MTGRPRPTGGEGGSHGPHIVEVHAGGIRGRLTYANVIATLALFAALGGTSVAAVSLGRNSVGNAQIKRNAVTSSKVRNRSLTSRDFKVGQLPTGARGATGATGPGGTPGTNGVDGRSALSTLRRGETERGVVGFDVGSAAANELGSGYASLPIPAPTGLDDAHVNVAGKDDGGVCTGSYANPTAPVGEVCIYVIGASNMKAGDPTASAPFGMATPYGFLMGGRANAAGEAYAEGDWAYTAG